MTRIAYLLTSSFLILSACKTAEPTTRPVEIGWTPFPTIRAFDQPGRIFRKDASGAMYGVATLDLSNPNCGGPEVTPAVKKNAKFVIGDVLETIGVAKEALPAEFNAQLSRTVDYDVESIDGTRECLDDRDVDGAMGRIADYFVQNNITVRPDNKYYLIRETFATKKLKFTSEKAWLGELGLNAEFRQQVKNKATLEWGNETKYSIDKTFDQPMRVWYRAERLNVRPALAAGPGQLIVSAAGKTDEQLILQPLVDAP